MPLILAGATSGSTTLQATDAITATITLPSTSGTVVVNNGAQTIEFADGSASAPSITNSGDTNTGMFFPAADTIAFTEGGTESMRINSSGIVLVNSSSADATSGISGAKLQVLGGIVAGIDGLGSGGTGYIAFNSAMASAPTAAHPIIYHRQSVGLGIQSDYAISFAINGSTEAMRLDSSGNLGLGVTPSTWTGQTVLQVGGGSTGASLGSGTNGVVLASNVIFNSGWKYLGNGFISYYQQSAGGHYWGGAASGTAGNTATVIDRMILDTSGNLLVGTTGATPTADAGVKLLTAFDGAGWPRVSVVTTATTNAQNNGFSFYSTGAGAYRFYVGAAGTIFATATTITAISDQRLKENVRDLDTGLDAIMEVKPRRFDWKEGKGLDKKDDVGFIAQEFETVFPNSVSESLAGEDGIEYKSLNHGELIPTLVKAIQELKAIVDTQAEQIKALQGAA